jgi:hypothetical protein
MGLLRAALRLLLVPLLPLEVLPRLMSPLGLEAPWL